jgi:hypothetical protein
MPGDPASGAPRHRAWIISALGDRFEFVRITDEQAIVIQGDQWTIRPSPQGSGVFRTYPVLCSLRWWDGICAGCRRGHAT